MERDYDRKFPTTIIAILAVAVTIAVILIAVFVYLSARNPYYGYGGNYGGMMGGYGGVWMLFMIPMGLIVLIMIGYAIWRGSGWGGGCGGRYRYYGRYGSDADGENAMEILHRRYARGEISKEQYEQMKKDIVS